MSYPNDPKYATLSEFRDEEGEGSTLYIDNDMIGSYSDAGELLLELHLTTFIEQALELLGLPFEYV